MQTELFDSDAGDGHAVWTLGAQARVLRGFARPAVPALLNALARIEHAAPLRQMQTPGGFTMSAAMTNCGAWGWITDRSGYRYARTDPLSGAAWPPLPEVLLRLACDAARRAGFPEFAPDACLVNCYAPGARMSLHQDRNELDFAAPIVSISLGLPAVFLFGGLARGDPAQRVPLHHGDVAVWGGIDRLRYHGVAPLRTGVHPQLGARRINFTVRKAR